tara:strand:+ start:1158 stop:1325 length:168 start_codon:yes stop_codon:yes gene_type:complete
MHAAIIRIKMQIEKIQDELATLEKQIDSLEEKHVSSKSSKFEENFSRDKEDFIAP